jgi:hypothetical protein
MALDLPSKILNGIDRYQGIEIDIAGNGERYNLHLRTSDLWLPWQSYRAELNTGAAWSRIRIPFREFRPYRTGKPLEISRLTSVGIVAIGRDFFADFCLGSISLYKDI